MSEVRSEGRGWMTTLVTRLPSSERWRMNAQSRNNREYYVFCFGSLVFYGAARFVTQMTSLKRQLGNSGFCTSGRDQPRKIPTRHCVTERSRLFFPSLRSEFPGYPRISDKLKAAFNKEKINDLIEADVSLSLCIIWSLQSLRQL